MNVIKMVRLGDLDHDPVALEGNEGRRLTKIDDLKASIPVHGLINSLKVRVDAEGTRYLVTAGNRRLATLKHLRDSGGSVRGELVTDEYQVPVIHSEESEAEAREISVAENMQRLPPTPVEEFKHFAKMAATTSIDEVAAHFGVTPQRVRGRLKLAGLHPSVLKALEDETISIAAAEAFTVEPDPARQAAYLKKAKGNSWQLQPSQIKQAFSQELVTGESWVAKLIGEEAYVAAGGEVMEDPFTGERYWLSKTAIEAALPAAWERFKAVTLDDGWGFVESIEAFGGTVAYQKAQRLHGAWKQGGYVYSDEQKALGGVVYWSDASYSPQFGVRRAGTKLPGQGGTQRSEPDATLMAPGWDVTRLLEGRLTAAIKAGVEADPMAALRLLVAKLHSDIRGDDERRFYASSVFDFMANDNGYAQAADEATTLPQGASFETALAWAGGAEVDALLAYLAELLAHGVRVGREDADLWPTIAFIDADLASVFDAADYFGAASKPLIVEALRDMGEEKKPEGAKQSREALQERAVALAAETGWLPPQLRKTSYTGPCVITPMAPAGEVEPQDDDDEDDEEFVEDELRALEAAE